MSQSINVTFGKDTKYNMFHYRRSHPRRSEKAINLLTKPGVHKKKAKSVLNTSVNSDKMAEEHKGENEEMTSVQGGKASSTESQLDDKAKHPSENDTSKHSDKKQEKSTASNHGNKTVK